MNPFSILIADGDAATARALFKTLDARGYSVRIAANLASASDSAVSNPPDLLICDLGLPGAGPLGGLRLLEEFRAANPAAPAIVIAEDSSAEMAIESTKRGAYDYLLKPLDPEEVAEVVRRAIRSSRVMAEPVQFDLGSDGDPKNAPAPQTPAHGVIVGRSRAMREIYKELGRIAAKPVTVLIRGETGTGKELVARAIFQHGHRAHMPFIAVNCAAIPETLLESELFGHEKGAFTGADTRRIGRFEQAHNGTIFLDEIGEIAPGTQAKLLRVLQERSIQRLGGREEIPVDVRVIAATNRDLERMIEAREFRADLFYRLNVVAINLPPLRERREDIPLLIKHFVAIYSAEFSTPASIEEEAIDFLSSLPWPGNIRQLENVIRRAILAARGFCITREVAEAVAAENAEASPERRSLTSRATIDGLINARLEEAATGKRSGVYAGLLREFEREVLAQAIRLAGGNQSRAARWLGITRLTLREKLVQFGLHPRDKSPAREA